MGRMEQPQQQQQAEAGGPRGGEVRHRAVPSSLAAAAMAREGPSPASSKGPRQQAPPQAPAAAVAAAAPSSSSSGLLSFLLHSSGGDRWTGLLAALWGLLFLALCVNKQELWVVLAGLVAYAGLCFLLDVVAIPALWPAEGSADRPLKAGETARLSNGLVCVAHAMAMGLAAALGASRLLKLTMACGFLLFDLWDKAWKRLYTRPPYRYTRGVPYAMQGATTLVLSITAVTKGIDLDADLLVALPALHLLVESLHDLTTLFASPTSTGSMPLLRLAELATLLPTRILPQAALLALHLLKLHAPVSLREPLGVVAPTEGVMTTWWATRVTTPLLVMLTAANLASLVWPAYLMRCRAAAQGKGKEEKGVDASKLWFIHGQAFDLASFASRHPGGQQALNLGKGRDCTALFESYHPFTEKHRTVLHKYRVAVPPHVLAENCVVLPPSPAPSSPSITTKEPPSAANGKGKQEEELLPSLSSSSTANGEEGEEEEALSLPKDEFYEVLKARVAQAMAGRDVVASSARRLYYALVAATVALTYYYGFLQGNWALLYVFALSSWLLGAAGHDGSHFACSHRPWVNALCGLGISLIASPFLWYHQHTFGHHSFTNDHEHDPDLHHFVLTRLHTKQPHGPQHRLQRFKAYVLLQYAVVAFGETVWIPVKLIFFRTLHGVLTIHMDLAHLAAALLHLVAYILLVFVLPARSPHLAGTSKVWAFPLVYVGIVGMLFGVFSQINHLNHASIASAGKQRQRNGARPNDGEAEADDNNQQEQEPSPSFSSWAAEQVETSANFATQSPFWFWLSNGLNFQIEHHLFPGINHEHLWRIQPAVKQTCQEFGVQYKSHDSMWSIVKETARYYRSLALPPTEVHA